MGRGDSPSRNWNVLQIALLLRVSALWMGRAVSQTDDAREAQLSMPASAMRATRGHFVLQGTLKHRPHRLCQ